MTFKGSRIGLGLAALGRPEYINVGTSLVDKTEEAFKKNTFNVLDCAYQKGVRYFDTAPSYGKGEQFLMEWHKNRKHNDVVFGTKWGYTYVADWKLNYSEPHEIKEHSVDNLITQWKVSKKMLPTLKIYQIHSATLESGVLDNSTVLEQLYQIKKETNIKIGITTSGAQQKEIIKKALNVSVKNEKLFDSFQSTFNVLEQSVLTILKKAKQEGKTIIIKEALANGRLFTNSKYPHYKSLYNTLNAMSQKYKVGIDAIALRYCLDALRPDIVLSGASNVSQLQQNLQGESFNLSKTDFKILETEKVCSDDYWKERSQLNWN